jgi:cellulose biosynthesis protein BcsQ
MAAQAPTYPAVHPATRPSTGPATRPATGEAVHPPVCVVVVGKGGDGKSSTATNVAAALAVDGTRVLLVDLDPQGTVTDHLVADGGPGVEDVLSGQARLLDLLVAVPVEEAGADVELCVVPSSPALVDVEAELSPDAVLDLVEEAGGRFDVVVLDTYASRPLGASARVLVGAFAAADVVLVPFQPTTNSLRALRHTLAAVDAVEARDDRELDVLLVPNRVPHTAEAAATIAALRAQDHALTPPIRAAVAVPKARSRFGFLDPRRRDEAPVVEDVAAVARVVAAHVAAVRARRVEVGA